MSDPISRRAVLELISTQPSEEASKGLLYQSVKQLPSVEPERKTGKWVHDGFDIPHGVDWMHCSICNRRAPRVPAAMTPYCPGCGAKMGWSDED